MKKKLAAALAVVLAVALAAGGTYAYLTDQDSAVNTFTVGHVTITLDEKNVDGLDAAGKDNSAQDRDTANKYHLLPGSDYEKDPTIHVDADSMDCWLFVRVANGLAAIEAKKDTAFPTIADQMDSLGWTETETGSGIFWYKEIVSAGADVPVFETIKIDGAVDKATLANYKDAAINVTAYAVQADNFDTALEALEAAPFPAA